MSEVKTVMTVKKSKKKPKARTLSLEMARVALNLPETEDKYQRSIKLRNLLKKIPQIPLQKLERWKDEVFDLGRKEGFDDMVIGKWVRKAMQDAGYSDRHVQNMLPDTAKQQQDHAFTRNYKKATAENTSTSASSVTADNIAEEGAAQQRQELEDEAPTGYYQIPVEEFKEEDIEIYDRIYLIKVLKSKCEEIRELLGRIQRLEESK